MSSLCHHGLHLFSGQNDDEAVSQAMSIASHPQTFRRTSDSHLNNFQPMPASQRQLFPDATVTVGGKDFLVHRNVLAAASPYFHCMFSSEMLEGESCLHLSSPVYSTLSCTSIHLHVQLLTLHLCELSDKIYNSNCRPTGKVPYDPG